MDKNYLVYKHTCPHGKSYIGITKNYEQRCYQHQTNKDCKAFYDAIMFFGWDNIKHEILIDGLDKESAIIQEELLIIKHNSLYPNGYNLRIKGGKNSGYRLKTTKSKRHENLEKKIKLEMSKLSYDFNQDCLVKTNDELLDIFGDSKNLLAVANKYRYPSLKWHDVLYPDILPPEWALFWSQVIKREQHQQNLFGDDNASDL